jgi:hypothetical protein
MEKRKKSSLEKWRQDVQPTKTAFSGAWAACVVLTTIIGFVSGGWMTDRASRKLDKDMADDANRLALICVAQFNQDPAKAAKLEALTQASGYERLNYVQDQGWATMPGEERPERWVADECVKLLLFTNP